MLPAAIPRWPTTNAEVTLYDQDGAAFTSNYITSQTEKIKVSVPIYRVNNIPLTVTLKDGGSLTQNQVQCVIDPENVEVIASNQAVLSDIKEINLGEIDLGSVHTGTPISMSIKDKLPSGVSLVSGQPETANVTISVDGVATRKVQVSSSRGTTPRRRIRRTRSTSSPSRSRWSCAAVKAS